MRAVVVVLAAAATKPMSLEIGRLLLQAFFYSPDWVIDARTRQITLAARLLPGA